MPRTLALLLSLALTSSALAAEPAAAEAAAPAATPATVPAASPAAAPAQPATPSPAGATAPEPYGKPSGLIPGVLLGPKLHLISAPPGLGVEARIANAFTVSLDYKGIPELKASGSDSEAKVKYGDLALAGRWHPWHGRFHLGAALGSRTFEASARSLSTPVSAGAKVESTYLAPEVGWRFIWRGGFFLGIDLGYQIILSSRTTFSFPFGVDPQDKQDVEDAADELGKLGFPVISLLQLGYYF